MFLEILVTSLPHSGREYNQIQPDTIGSTGASIQLTKELENIALIPLRNVDVIEAINMEELTEKCVFLLHFLYQISNWATLAVI